MVLAERPGDLWMPGFRKPIGPTKSPRGRQKESLYAESEGLSHFQKVGKSQTVITCYASVLANYVVYSKFSKCLAVPLHWVSLTQIASVPSLSWNDLALAELPFHLCFYRKIPEPCYWW